MSGLLDVVVPLLPALVAVAAVALFALGWRQLRLPPVEGLEVGDLVLMREAGGGEPTSILRRLGGRLVPLLRRLAGPNGISWLQRQIQLAGRPKGATVDDVLRETGGWLVLVSPAVVLFVVQGKWLFIVVALAAALVLPMASLSRQRRLRQERLDRDLPDFLDILSVTVTAGVAFRPALARVADQYGGPLAEEMGLTLSQIANGASRRVAFTGLRDRNDSEALSQFVTAFLQSEELGAPLSETLGQIAADMRRSNAQRLRRKAAQAVPRVTLVTTILLVPGAIVLIAGGLYIGGNFDLGAMFGGAR